MRPLRQSAEPPDDPLRDLMARVARGDSGALSDLYDAASPRVYGLALHVVREPEAAQEICLDVFVQVWRTASSFDPSRGSVVAWLLTIARTRAIDHLRTRVRHAAADRTLESVLDTPDPGKSPEDSIADAARARKLRVALASLSHEQRAAIEAAYFGGLSHSEVALSLGQPLGTIKTRIRDGLTVLRRMLAAQQEGSLS